MLRSGCPRGHVEEKGDPVSPVKATERLTSGLCLGLNVKHAASLKANLFTTMVSVTGTLVLVYTVFGFYSFVISLPILVLTYVAYRSYLGRVETSRRHIEGLTRLHLAT